MRTRLNNAVFPLAKGPTSTTVFAPFFFARTATGDSSLRRGERKAMRRKTRRIERERKMRSGVRVVFGIREATSGSSFGSAMVREVSGRGKRVVGGGEAAVNLAQRG